VLIITAISVLGDKHWSPCCQVNPVIDESTSPFMKRFYQLREQNNFIKAEALRQVQLSMITTSGDKFAQPYYWAPFVLMGSWL